VPGESGSLARRFTIPAGSPLTLDVSPNGRYLVAKVEAGDGVKLSVWRLDGANPTMESRPTPPAAVRPR